MATQQQPKYWTYDDLFTLPDDGKRYEIIEGELYEMPSANITHATIIMNLILQVFGPLIGVLGGRLFTAPLDVFMLDANPVQPDIFVLLPEQFGLRSKRGVEGPPALVVEVLSPSTRATDLTLKRHVFEQAGVASYWLFDPDVPSLTVLELADASFREVAVVTGDEAYDATLPFPIRVVPALLVR